MKSGETTLRLDGGDYCPETVPFSFAFATWQERTVVIHRTAWNRLDVSDALTGQLLTSRGPTSYMHGESRPPHYLDYFHGALHVSPMGTRILDDGWVWHPVGIPAVWNMERWLSQNCWESEDGESRKEVCARESYWDHAIVWLDKTRVAIGGLGDDDSEIVDGARIFDVTSAGPAGRHWRSDWVWARELTAFPGPSGRFFSDGEYLYSSDQSGLSRWNYKAGTRVNHIADFYPTHHHVGSKELVEVADGMLLRWSTIA